jgi:xanthine dehydrogenase large subunit
MAMTWADNAYYLPNYMARAKVCYTNTPARTFARAPGVLQSNLVTGVVIDRVAFELGMDPATVKNTNFIAPGLSTIVGQVCIYIFGN